MTRTQYEKALQRLGFEEVVGNRRQFLMKRNTRKDNGMIRVEVKSDIASQDGDNRRERRANERNDIVRRLGNKQYHEVEI